MAPDSCDSQSRGVLKWRNQARRANLQPHAEGCYIIEEREKSYLWSTRIIFKDRVVAWSLDRDTKINCYWFTLLPKGHPEQIWPEFHIGVVIESVHISKSNYNALKLNNSASKGVSFCWSHTGCVCKWWSILEIFYIHFWEVDMWKVFWAGPLFLMKRIFFSKK